MTYVSAISCVILCIAFAVLVIAWKSMIWMPGRSYRNVRVPLDRLEDRLRESLQQDLTMMAQDIGERNIAQKYAQFIKAAGFIERSLQEYGYEIRRQEFDVDENTVWNIDAECAGRNRPGAIIIVGTHYDTALEPTTTVWQS